MNRLFTYTIPHDDGAAPNPFNGLCTLAICKPRIRSAASVGDWVAGLGSKDAPSGDLSGKLVYAMKVKEKITLEQYDARCRAEWPSRIPETKSSNLQDRLGDCIYDYTSGQPKLRPSVHSQENMETDLSGVNVLIAEEFYYFGSKAIALPAELLDIRHPNQGHKSNCNNELVKPFVQWISGLGYKPGLMHGWPDRIINWEEGVASNGCSVRVQAANGDC